MYFQQKTICVIEAHSSASAVVHGATLDHPILWLARDVPDKFPHDVILHMPTADTENGKERPFHVQGLPASTGLMMETLWSRRIHVVLERQPSGNDAALCSCAQIP